MTDRSHDAFHRDDDGPVPPPGTPYETFVNALRSEVDALRCELAVRPVGLPHADRFLAGVLDRLPQVPADQNTAAAPHARQGRAEP
jgi:hypothetical protein